MKSLALPIAVSLLYLPALAWAEIQESVPQAAVSEQTLSEQHVELSVAQPVEPGYTAMSSHERWHGFLHENLLSNGAALKVIGAAVIDHLGTSSKQWGDGPGGFFRRVDSRLATIVLEGAVHSSLAALLHEDTRYWRSRDTNPWRRAGHAVKRTFVTYNDSGRRVFDVANFASMYGGPMASTCWHPHLYPPIETGFRSGNIAVAAQAGANLLREFSPDIKRLFSRK